MVISSENLRQWIVNRPGENALLLGVGEDVDWVHIKSRSVLQHDSLIISKVNSILQEIWIIFEKLRRFGGLEYSPRKLKYVTPIIYAKWLQQEVVMLMRWDIPTDA